jgi:hypothetical protein
MTLLIIFSSIVGISILACAYLLYRQMRLEGDRDWLMRVTNKKGIPD